MRVRNALQRVSQGSLTNPVSGLPEGALVDEHLDKCMKKGDLALLLISLEHLDAFRELIWLCRFGRCFARVQLDDRQYDPRAEWRR